MGTSSFRNFSCDIKNLLGQDQYFYELYLYDRKSQQSLPVPVRLVNQLVDPKERNKATTTSTTTGTTTTASVTNIYPYFVCDDGDNVVRRFFLTDLVSGISSSSVGTGNPQVMRYASYMMLETSLSPTAYGKIFAPVLTIYYNETSVAPILQGTSSSITNVAFDTSYTMSVAGFRTNMTIIFIIA